MYALDVKLKSISKSLVSKSFNSCGFVTVSFAYFAPVQLDFKGACPSNCGVFSLVESGVVVDLDSLLLSVNSLSVVILDSSPPLFKPLYKGRLSEVGLKAADSSRPGRFFPFRTLAEGSFEFQLVHAVGVGTSSGHALELEISLHHYIPSPVPRPLSSISTQTDSKEVVSYRKIAVTGRIVRTHIEIPHVEPVEVDWRVYIDAADSTTTPPPPGNDSVTVDPSLQVEEEECSNEWDDSLDLRAVLPQLSFSREPLVPSPPPSLATSRHEPPLPTPPQPPVRRRWRAPPPSYVYHPPTPKASHYMMDTAASKSRMPSDIKYLRVYKEEWNVLTDDARHAVSLDRMDVHGKGKRNLPPHEQQQQQQQQQQEGIGPSPSTGAAGSAGSRAESVAKSSREGRGIGRRSVENNNGRTMRGSGQTSSSSSAVVSSRRVVSQGVSSSTGRSRLSPRRTASHGLTETPSVVIVPAPSRPLLSPDTLRGIDSPAVSVSFQDHRSGDCDDLEGSGESNYVEVVEDDADDGWTVMVPRFSRIIENS